MHFSSVSLTFRLRGISNMAYEEVFLQQPPGVFISGQATAQAGQQTPFEGIPTKIPTYDLTNCLIRLESKVEGLQKQLQRPVVSFVKINFLAARNLRMPIDAVIEGDETGFTARALELPLYGSGDDPKEAIDMLKREIESLYDDLSEDDNFTADWPRIKKYLSAIVIDEK
jgi:hypothetical protein